MPTELIEQLLEALKTERLLCDARFTECYVRSKLARGFGPARIKDNLKQKGISLELIEHYLADAISKTQENLIQAWRKKFANKAPNNFQEYAKQARFLQYRGFDMSLIKAFLDSKKTF